MISKQAYLTEMSHRSHFSMNPNEIWETKELDVFAKAIWAYIVAQAPKWKSSRNNIARNLGIWGPLVTEKINLLERLNLLRVIRDRSGWSFEIVPPSEWKIEKPERKQPTSDTVAPDRIRSTETARWIESDPVVDRIRSTYKKQKNNQKEGFGDGIGRMWGVAPNLAATSEYLRARTLEKKATEIPEETRNLLNRFKGTALNEGSRYVQPGRS